MNPVAILQKVEQISSTHNEHFTNFRIFVHSNEIRNLMMKCNDMNPKQFLQIGGVVLIVVGLLGFFGLIGPTAESSIFGSAWWFDNGENWAHTILGVVALIAAGALKSDAAKKNLVLVVGIVGIFFAVYNIFSTTFLGTNLESPLDLILHLVVGVWALWAAMRKPSMAPAGVGMNK